ncbi:hypothetical protein [Haloferax sulfurifontis]|uniref:Uncharacterized protein n=2 Tax=Haloferax sulfurifontis TaxID=255616 RepID=M0I8Q6_9EURY|nr:hypothetical protein [Haloferax sulfurifontis]ELZ93161.1 hypothetical protein C441_09746 [Haloferax sulfurifontis ATCC BAA-897]GGC53816.1 hypothetical protein GCM10007209_14430 [Haloferax sulfurifontis]
MNLLWQVGSVGVVALGVAYLAFPARIHAFGFEFLRRPSPDGSEKSAPPVWLYRGIGALLVFMGLTRLA